MEVSSAIAARVNPAFLTGKQTTISVRFDRDSAPVFDTMFEIQLPPIDPASMPEGAVWEVAVPPPREDFTPIEPPAVTSMKMAPFATIYTATYGKIEVSNAGYVSSDAAMDDGWHLVGLDHLMGPALAQAIVQRFVERYGGAVKPAGSAMTQADYDAIMSASQNGGATPPAPHAGPSATADLMRARELKTND